MTDMRNEMDSDLDQNYSLNSNVDPKNMQELTIYVSFSLLSTTKNTIQQQKQHPNTTTPPTPKFPSSPSFPYQVQNLLQNVQDKFQTMSDQIITRIDDMGNRIDDLEKSIADLMNQAGVEGPGPEK